MKTLFIEAKSTKSILPAAKLILKELKDFNSIGLLATVQFVHQLDKVKKIFEAEGKKVFIGRPREHCIYSGQVLGCDVNSALEVEEKVDCFVYFGTGQFHPLGIALKTEKPVFKVDPFTEKIERISEQEKKIWLKKQAARVSKVKDAKIIGILVSTKPGQYKNVEGIKEKLEKQGKEVYILICDTINSQELANFTQIQAWINTACPRIVDDQELFSRPIANIEEVL